MFRATPTRAYVFREDGQYSRYSLSADRGDYVRSFQGMWPASIQDKYMDISASFLAPNGTTYMFLKDGTYLRYYYNGDKTQGPFDTANGWPGISRADARKIVAALPWKGNDIIYLFLNNGKYIKYSWSKDRVIAKNLITYGNWPGVSQYAKEITGAMKWNNNKGYIFLTGNRYLRYDFNADRARAPKSTSALWPKLLD